MDSEENYRIIETQSAISKSVISKISFFRIRRYHIDPPGCDEHGGERNRTLEQLSR